MDSDASPPADDSAARPSGSDRAEGTRDIGSAGARSPDLACVFCGYDLTGTPVDGCCPECGRAVRLTVDPDWIRLSGRDELERLARACVGAWALPLYGAGFVLFMFATQFVGSNSASGVTLGACSGILGIVAGGVSTWSWRRLLARRDGVPFRPGWWGKLAVAAGALTTLGPVLWLLGMWLQSSVDWGAALAAAGVLGMVGFGATHIACAMGGLARRFAFMHRARAARWARIFGWCALGPIGIAAGGLVALVLALSNLGGGPGPNQTERALGAMAMILFLASWAPSIAALIGGGVQVSRFRRLVEAALLGPVGEERADDTGTEPMPDTDPA